MSGRRWVAWGVHAYTALGLVLAALAAVRVVEGSEASLRAALLLLFAATVIDATDGWLARAARVREVLPGFDGRRLDDIVDFHTYTSLPLLLVWRSGVLPDAQAAWLLVPLLASAYGFSQTEAKTRDGYFLGFPSYWNVVAFYLVTLRPPPGPALAALVGLALLTGIPMRYLYPSQPGWLNRAAAVLGLPWALAVLAVLLEIPDDPRGWALISLVYPALYLLASWGLALARRPRLLS